jgi:hypothetical protein
LDVQIVPHYRVHMAGADVVDHHAIEVVRESGGAELGAIGREHVEAHRPSLELAAHPEGAILDRVKGGAVQYLPPLTSYLLPHQ